MQLMISDVLLAASILPDKYKNGNSYSYMGPKCIFVFHGHFFFVVYIKN